MSETWIWPWQPVKVVFLLPSPGFLIGSFGPVFQVPCSYGLYLMQLLQIK